MPRISLRISKPVKKTFRNKDSKSYKDFTKTLSVDNKYKTGSAYQDKITYYFKSTILNKYKTSQEFFVDFTEWLKDNKFWKEYDFAKNNKHTQILFIKRLFKLDDLTQDKR